MTEEPELPEAPAPNPTLDYFKHRLRVELVAACNSVSAVVLNTYPLSEIYSWPFQRPEAEAVLAAGESASIEMAPFLDKVCEMHFGPVEDPADRLAQIIEKAEVVQDLGNSFLAMAAALNGLRARGDDAISAAASEFEALEALRTATTSLEDFRRAAGF